MRLGSSKSRWSSTRIPGLEQGFPVSLRRVTFGEPDHGNANSWVRGRDRGPGGAGGYALLPAGMRHYAWIRAGATVQVNGMGPFVINYVNPADDPSKVGPAAK